ncbi:MAG: glycosyltransferase family 2 protein [Spirochaetales bacterium]|nr:glycosyltransferase family 2 protein [Spirochaetales bacterium]
MQQYSEPVSIIIPAYNEETSIGEEIQRIKDVMNKAGIIFEIIVVDDASKDNTANIAQEAGSRVFHHLTNRGYGASLKTGIYEARYETIVITDADGTYPCKKIPDLLAHIDNADMVVGERTGKDVKIPLLRKPAKWFLRKLAQFVTGEKIRDLNSGLRVFRKRFVNQYLTILSDRFSFTTTLTVAAISDDFKIEYLPIDYYKRRGKSKIVPWDFFNFIVLVLRLSMFFNPLKVFIPIFILCFTTGLIKFGLDIYFGIVKAQQAGVLFFSQPVISGTTLIMLLGGLIILLIGMMSDALSRRIAQGRIQNYKTHWKGYIQKNPGIPGDSKK